MPYRLQITKEEVEEELREQGYENLSPELVEAFRKDLLKLIKDDLKKLRRLRELEAGSSFTDTQSISTNYHGLPSTSTPSSDLELEKEKEKYERFSSTEEYGSESASNISQEDFELLSEKLSSASLSSKEKLKYGSEGSLLSSKGKQKKLKDEELPSYPDRPDPVNLYHYYKAHWDKFKAPGEDPRSALRWEVRSKLFYSS